MPFGYSLITTLVAGFVLAFIFGLVANRLRLSPLVGYIVAGVLVGPYTPGFVADVALAPQLAEIGVILLMFGVGLHFSPRELLDVRRIAIPGALGQIALATFLGWLLGEALGLGRLESLFMGFAVSIASTVVLARALEERQALKTPTGHLAIGWLIVEDLVIVVALVLLPVLAGEGEGSPLLDGGLVSSRSRPSLR
jgi:CPA2 family monovalent cation:H+ antiporter-2